MDIKTIQAQLKQRNVKATQSQINQTLTKLKLTLSDVKETDIDAIAAEFGNKITLQVPSVGDKLALDESQTNESRQSSTNSRMTDAMIETIEAISDRNVSMVQAMPGLVRNRTIQKLQNHASEIQDAWDDVNGELSDIMFGL